MASGDKILFKQGAESSVNATAKVAGQLLYATYNNSLQTSAGTSTEPQGNIYFDLDNSTRIQLANDVDKARTLFAGATKTNDVPGAWNVDIQGITELYDGLTIKIRLNTSYNSTYNTLNVNNLGNKLVWYRYNSRLTSHIPQYAEVFLTYRVSCGTYTTTANSTGVFATGTACTDGWILNAAYQDGNNYERYYPTYIRKYVGANPIYPYHFVAVDVNGKWTPLNITNSTNTTTARTWCTVPFYPQHIYINPNNSTYNANSACGTAFYEALPFNGNSWIRQNFGRDIPTYCRIYIQGSYNYSTGLFSLDTTTPFVFISTSTTAQDSFTTDKFYIYLGDTYSSANYMQLALVNSLYKFNGSGLVEVTAALNNYGGITIGANSSSENAVSALNSNLAVRASTYSENISINPGNKWIRLNGTEGTAGNDVILIAHDLVLSNGTAGTTYGITGDATPALGSGNFKVPQVIVDAAGHVTSIAEYTITMPNYTNSRDSGYGKFVIGANSSSESALTALTSALTVSAKTYNEAISINPGNKWISLNGTESTTAGSDVLQIGHALVLSAGSAGTAYGQASAITPNLGGGTFKVPSIIVDAAGHVTSIGESTITMPSYTNSRDNGYGKITTSANSDAVTDLTAQTAAVTVESTIYNETLKLTTANKWIKLAGTNSSTANADEIKIAHSLLLTSGSSGTAYGLTANATPALGGGTFKVPTLTVDAAGHVTAVGEYTITMPGYTNSRDPGYGQIKVGANSSAVSALAAQSSDVTLSAGTYNELLTYKPANKWIRLSGTNSSTNESDVLQIGHDLTLTSGTAGTTYGLTEDKTPALGGGTFKVPKLIVDAAGHVTTVGEFTITMPSYTNSRDNGYGKITTSANSDSTAALTAQTSAVTVEANTYNETLKLTTANKWIKLLGSNSSTSDADEIKIAHDLVLTQGSAGTAYGQTSAATPALGGGTFSVPNIKVDAAGHVTDIGHVTITMPGYTNSRDPGYGQITLGANSDSVAAVTALSAALALSATSYNEKITISPGNKWIRLNGTQSGTKDADTMVIGHELALTSGSANTNYGTTTTQTYYAGASTNPSFKVPKLKVDAAGHVTEISEATVTIAHQDTSSASNLTASGRRYVTGLTFDTYGHVIDYTTGTETVSDTDTKVSQSGTNSNNWRKVLISNQTTTNPGDTLSGTTTDVSYFDQQTAVNASTGTLRSKVFRILNNAEMQYNTTDNSIDFVFI